MYSLVSKAGYSGTVSHYVNVILIFDPVAGVQPCIASRPSAATTVYLELTRLNALTVLYSPYRVPGTGYARNTCIHHAPGWNRVPATE